MKLKLNISNRERWILALSPAILIGGIYLMYYMDGLTKGLTDAQTRLAAAQIPAKPPGPPAALAKAKAALDDLLRNNAERQAKLEKMDADIAALSAAAVPEDRQPARIIERVEAVFAHNGITPLISTTADEGPSAARVPGALLAALSPKPPTNAPAERRAARVWYYQFDDVTPHFEIALRELVKDIPGVVPLSLNFVYNPRDDGETRLLELWLLY